MALALACAALLAAAPAAPSGGALVLPMSGGADAAVRSALGDQLRDAIAALGTPVISKAETEQQLKAAKSLGLACSVDAPGCAFQLGGLAGAHLVIVAVAAKDGDRIVVTARLLDVPLLRERRSARVTIAAAAAFATPRHMKLLAVRLSAPEAERGSIQVGAKPDGATVLVDGVVRGTAPRTIEVSPGKHEVYVARAGYDSQTHTVDVAFDDTVMVDFVLVAGAGDTPLPFALVADREAPTELDAPAPVVGEKKKFLRVAVYELDAADFPPRVPRVITQAMLVEMRKLEGISVVGLDEIRAMLDFEANRQLAGCSDAGCLAEVAGALGADVIVIGQLAHVGDGTVFGARRLDQRTAQASAQVSKRFVDAGGEEFIAAVGDVVAELFPELPLRAGMRRGADPELALRVNPPPLPPWTFWTTIAGASAAGLATVAVASVNQVSANKFGDVEAVVRGRDVVANEDVVFATGVAFYVGVAVTATTLAAAGVEALFVDWWGYGKAP